MTPSTSNSPLAGKVALVTGGSRGIGAAIARRLARDGAAVALTYSASPDKAATVAKEITSAGRKAKALAADNTDAKAVVKAVTDTVAAFGRLDILVNNAGVGILKPIQEFTLEEYDHLMGVNLRAVFVASQEAIKHMSKNAPEGHGSRGRIITIGSCLGEHVGFAGSSVYSASKAAVIGFTKGLARDVGGLGITANLVEPGPIDTDMNPKDGQSADHQRRMLAIQRFGHADEIASTVAHLAGPESGFITGASILVDGGFAA